MSKVEELREKVEVAIFHVEDNESMYLAIGMLDSLIAAAKEEERERILGEAEEAKAEIGHVVVWTEFEGTVFIIPASVLSPAPKEEK